MKELEPRQAWEILEVQGWLELGVPGEALNTLNQIEQEVARRPQVLTLRWAVLIALRRWKEATAVMSELFRDHPHLPMAWRVRAETIRHREGLDAAVEFLTPVADLFPADSGIRYMLACFECDRGEVDEARRWLVEAFRVVGEDPEKIAADKGTALKEIYRKALVDSHLQPLWK